MATFLENLLIQPENIRDLSQLINIDTLRDERIQDYVRVVRAKNGDPVGLIGKGNPIGTTGCGCDPTYGSLAPFNALKRWELGCWVAPLKICYTEMEGTIAEYALKTGTAIGDLNGTQVMSEVIYPIINDLLVDLIWRIAWFGDTDAENITDGGSITNGVDTDLITVADGLWKRIFAQVAVNSAQRTAITTNTKAAMTAQGAATALIDQMLIDAGPEIMAKSGKVIYMTQALATAFDMDLRKSNCCNLPWNQVTEGITTTTYNGITYVAVAKWDELIATFENGAMPYRAILTTKDNLLVGTPAGEFVNDFDFYFDRISRNFYIYGTGKIGTMLLEDKAFQAAY